jgi:hypothetical protein
MKYSEYFVVQNDYKYRNIKVIILVFIIIYLFYIRMDLFYLKFLNLKMNIIISIIIIIVMKKILV